MAQSILLCIFLAVMILFILRYFTRDSLAIRTFNLPMTSSNVTQFYNPSVTFDESSQTLFFYVRKTYGYCTRTICDKDGKNESVFMSYFFASMPKINSADLKDETSASKIHTYIKNLPSKYKINHEDVNSTSRSNQNIEDLRLFIKSTGDLKGIGTYVSDSGKNKIVVATIDKHKLYITSLNPIKYDSNQNQKNWVPIEEQDDKFVQNWNSYTLVTIKNDIATDIYRENIDSLIRRGVRNALNLKNARGGTQVIRWDKTKYITIIHTRDLWGKSYRHLFVLLDNDLRIIDVFWSNLIHH